MPRSVGGLVEQIHIRAESCKEPAAWSADQRYRGPEQFDDEEALAADAEGGWGVHVGCGCCC